MNKTKVKNFAVSAHKLLVEQIKIKAFEYEITDSTMPDINTNSVHSRLLDQSEKEQLKALIKAIKVHGYNHVIEEIAYTWFNRFIALRFMEINNFLPQKIPRRKTRSVSYYAFFEGWLLLSQLPDCLSLPTSFST